MPTSISTTNTIHDLIISTTIPYLIATNTTTTNSINSSDAGNISKSTASNLEETNPRLVNGVVVLLLMLLNIGGNGLVLYVYHSLYKNTVFCQFMKALASLDLLTAVTTMLIDVLMKMRPNNEDVLNTTIMCKLSHYQVYANSMASGCVLTLIAYQRYRKICHPLQRGMTIKQAKILLVVISIACLVISIPTIFLHGARNIKVLVRGTVVSATICRADESYQNTPLNLAFYYTLMVAFSLVLGSTCILYCLVSRAIRKFEQRSSITCASSPITSSPRMESINEEFPNGNHQPRDSPFTARTLLNSPVNGRPVIMKDPYQNNRRSLPTSPHAYTQAQNPKKKDRFSMHRTSTFSVASSTNVISAQMYRVFTIIAIVYIVSYLPHLLALILTKTLKLDDRVLTYVQRMMLEFAYNCPYISTVSNPIIYGFSSSEFRDHVRDLLRSWDCCECCCCCCCCCCYDCDDCSCSEVFDCCDDCKDDDGGKNYAY